jgi:uncharacterized membrane protein
LVLSLVGLGVAVYLTIAHYDTAVSLACSSNGAINCEKVTTSAQSEVFGIPVALLGLLYFVAMIPLQTPIAWRSGHPLVRFGRVAYVVAGIGFVCYLVYAEAMIIKAICLWCTAVHVITFLIFVTTAFATALSFPSFPSDDDDTGDDDIGGDGIVDGIDDGMDDETAGEAIDADG